MSASFEECPIGLAFDKPIAILAHADIDADGFSMDRIIRNS